MRGISADLLGILGERMRREIKAEDFLLEGQFLRMRPVGNVRQRHGRVLFLLRFVIAAAEQVFLTHLFVTMDGRGGLNGPLGEQQMLGSRCFQTVERAGFDQQLERALD